MRPAEILRLLQSARGSLLDDEQLILTLQSSKNTSEEIKQQLAVAEQTEIKIDQAREAYRPTATASPAAFQGHRIPAISQYQRR